jgi:hypothetical protein
MIKLVPKKFYKYCIDCNKKLNDFAYWNGQIRCRSCSCKERLKITENNPMFGTHRKNKDNPNYKTGNFCKDKHIYCEQCGKEISKTTKHNLCQNCVNLGNHHALKDGRSLKIYHCIDCGKIVNTYSNRCRKCAGIKHGIDMKGKCHSHYEKKLPPLKYRKYCKKCHKLLSQTAYWSNIIYCRKCVYSIKSKNHIIKKYHCVECNKEVSNYKAKRCLSCSRKYNGKMRKIKYQIIYKENPIPKGKNICKCGNFKTKKSKQCQKCYIKILSLRKGQGKGRKITKFCKCGKKLSRNYYDKCLDCAAKERKGNNNPMFGKIAHHGKWVKYKGIKMRSTWEVKYAKWLDKQGTKWQYESKTFDLGNTTYTPDFYLPETDTYVEIKGWWRDDAKEKFELFRKKYYSMNIILLMKKELKKMGILK